MHTVAVLALDSVVPSDLATPIDVFSLAQLPDGRSPYRVKVCGTSPEIVAGDSFFSLRAPYGLEGLAEADTVVVPGRTELTDTPPEALDALRTAAAAGARIASVCTGAFTLAETGLLDGLRATTHWSAAPELAARYPQIEVDADVLYVDNGRLLTSAGAAAGLDLCLYLIRKDLGSAVAADTARRVVMPLEREGGQAQFIVQDRPATPRGAELEPLLRWLEENCDNDLTLADIADQAGMSTRTLNRRFRDQIGSTPLQWLLRARVRQAQYLLEATNYPIDRIAARSGFGSPTVFRDRFKRVVGTTPATYRAHFRGSTSPGARGVNI